MKYFETIDEVLNYLVESGKISHRVRNDQKYLFSVGFGVAYEIRVLYEVDEENERYLVK